MADTQQSQPTAASSTNTTTQPRPLQMGAKGAYIVRLLMVGDSACGKTSLVLRFDQNVFSTKFVTTIGVDYRDKMIKVGTVSPKRETHGRRVDYDGCLTLSSFCYLFWHSLD